MISTFGKKRVCLYIVTLNDYVQAFKHLGLNYHFKKGGPLDQALGRSPFFLWKKPNLVTQSSLIT
jgi:hypothetical protein